MKRIYFLSLIFLLSACIKRDPPAPTGEAKVSFVNAVIGSEDQAMFINGSRVPNSAPLSYGAFSPYTTITSGENAFAFADVGVTEGVGNAGAAGIIDIGANLSVFYFERLLTRGGGKTAGIVYDDVSPVEGKAKVRFMHLNNHLDNFINIRTSDGTILNEGIAFGVASAYYPVAPGTKFRASATGVVDPLEVDFDFKAGKNYTIWLDGTSATVLTAHAILNN